MNAQVHEFPDRGDARQPPANVEAEQNVLGALMLDPKAMARLELAPEDFYLRQHRELYRVLVEMDSLGQPLDALTVGDYVETRGLADKVGGASYLVELASLTWVIGNARAYANIVRERATLRRVIELAGSLMQEAFQPNGRTPEQIVDGAVGELMKMAKVRSNCDLSLRQAVKLAFEDAQEAYEHRGSIRGVPTGFARMDARLGGLHAQDLIFMPARPGQGKTALAVNMMLTAADASYTVGMISGEQSAMQLGQRSLAVDSRTRAEAMRNGRIDDDAWPKLSASAARLAQQRIRIYDRSAPSLDEVVRTARRWRQEFGMGILFVDYLQRIRVRGAASRHEEVAEVAVGLKTLARDLDIPVVCLAQVKADVETRNDKRPRQGDIANSDEATREADQIIFLYRDEVYHDDPANRGIAELNVEKNRHGPTGQFKVGFDAETMRFHDLEEEPEYAKQPAAPRRARSVPVRDRKADGRSRAAGEDS